MRYSHRDGAGSSAFPKPVNHINRFPAWMVKRSDVDVTAACMTCLTAMAEFCLRRGLVDGSMFTLSGAEVQRLLRRVNPSDIRGVDPSAAERAVRHYLWYLHEVEGDCSIWESTQVQPEEIVLPDGPVFRTAEIPEVPDVPDLPEISQAQEVPETRKAPKTEQIPTAEEPFEPRCMEIVLGIGTEDGQPVLWRPNDTDQLFHTNTGVIGTMGTGKTQLTKSLITQLYRQQDKNFDGHPLGILIFDYKGDYNESKPDFVRAVNARVLKPYHLPFNPLALTKPKVFHPLLPTHTANAFKDTISKVYHLGPKQQNTLFRCIMKAYEQKGILSGNPATWNRTPPTFDTVYSLYCREGMDSRMDSLAAAMQKLAMFEIFEGRPEKTVSLFRLLNGVVVIDISGYDPDIQSLIVAITLDLFYAQMQASGSSRMQGKYRQLRQFILVDEADNFMSEGFPSLRKILKEGREFGVGTILSTQFLKHFGTGDDDYSKYILTWAVHHVADLRTGDVDFVFHTEPRSAEEQRLFLAIKQLEKHHSMIQIGNAPPRQIKNRAFWELSGQDGAP